VNCQQDDALLVADRMRKAVEGMEILTDGQILKITASFGVYTYYNQDIDMRQLVEFADKNLYAAKKSGRNSVVAG
jgi:diguanylate cyclase (GGDEF)-like protein